MFDLRPIKVIVFDFDGTLVDSNLVKREAWRKIFDDRPTEDNIELQKNVDAKVGDRFKILEVTFTALGEENARIPDLIKKYAAKYNYLTQTATIEAGLFPGVSETLEVLKKSHRLYLNSITPYDVLFEVTKALRIADYFSGFSRSEFSKAENLRRYVASEKVDRSEVLMVGDGLDDLAGAREFGCNFIGVANERNGWMPDFAEHPVIKNISELLN